MIMGFIYRTHYMDDATLTCFHVKGIQQYDAFRGVISRSGVVSLNDSGLVLALLELTGHFG